MDENFVLHERLAADTVFLASWPLSDLLLMNDAHYPWLILVPRRAGVSEVFQLSEVDQQQLLKESSWLGKWLMVQFNGDKLNVAALGNLVPQLHVHHVVRFRSDVAWPAPVWGKVPAVPYAADILDDLKKRLEPLTRLFEPPYEL